MLNTNLRVELNQSKLEGFKTLPNMVKFGEHFPQNNSSQMFDRVLCATLANNNSRIFCY